MLSLISKIEKMLNYLYTVLGVEYKYPILEKLDYSLFTCPEDVSTSQTKSADSHPQETFSFPTFYY